MIDRKEFRRIRDILLANGWRIQPTQDHRNTRGSQAKALGGRHVHTLCYPPSGGDPVQLGESGDHRARRNNFAEFRRAGIELDPNRIQLNESKQRRIRKE